MAENNSSAPLLPCPFCGGAAAVQKESPAGGGYFVECKSCRASTNLRYACGDGPLPLLVAQWNARAPSKTAEGAYPALPAPDTHCHDEDTSRDVWSYSAEQMHAYAALAVAAQAAPAAVAVPENMPAAYLHFAPKKPELRRVDFLRNASKSERGCGWITIPLAPFQAAPTPALPATEDSSAGDLAEEKISDEMSREERMIVLQRDSDGTPTVWCDPEIADIVCVLNSGGVKTVASCSGHGVKPGGIALADGRQLLLLESLEAFNSAMSAITQAVVQAEPVIYVSRGQLDDFANPVHDGGHYLPVRRTPLGLLSYPLYTAPQAQPADALERDVRTALQMLQDREWAENFAKSDLGKQLESAITDLHSEIHEAHESDDAEVAAMAAAQEGGNAAKEA